MSVELLKRINELTKAVERHIAVGHLAYQKSTWTPTFTGFSANPTGGVYRYVLIGKLCTCFVYMPNAGTSNDTKFYLTAPFTAADTGGNFYWHAAAGIYDNTAWQAAEGSVHIFRSDSTFRVCKSGVDENVWTNSGAKCCWFTITYEIA